MRMISRLAGLAAALFALPALAGTYDLRVARTTIDIDGRDRPVIAINGTVPAPTLRFREGEDLVINVTNGLEVPTSIHWHGLILPDNQDGAPGFGGYSAIPSGSTFTYRFPTQQSGTYWYHSHSGLQEQEGMYGAIIIEPKTADPFTFDREYAVVLSDSHSHKPMTILSNLKKEPDYYNRQQRTLSDFMRDVREKGFSATLSDRADWGDMRMMPTDISDVQGYDYLVNGVTAAGNWTAVYKPGERVRLRLVNASAMTYYDVRIPGLRMTVVQSDGNNVRPVVVDELRIAVAETYDVIVEPEAGQPYTIFAETLARDGYARATLATGPGMSAPVPALRERPLLTMADMAGHAGHGDHGDHGDHGSDGSTDHSKMGHAVPQPPATDHSKMDHSKMDHSKMDHSKMDHSKMDHSKMDHSKMDHSKMDHSKMDHSKMDHSKMDHGAMAMDGPDPFYAPGSGLTPSAANGGRFLSYRDLEAVAPLFPRREPDRTIEIRLTGNMERYSWSMNDVPFVDADPIRLRYGERVRFRFVNTTMMTHPMHLHGMWFILDNGMGEASPAKHVVSVAPGTTVEADVEVDAPGEWPFHCHLMYHMDAGMFRRVIVEGGPDTAMLRRGG
ncbi:MAG: copper resistance system multicopper oxidase [Pseudomonadota bacterium]|nr:copper resistance system multicopper oxidase [Pseudomonadota bacterium]